MQKSKGKNKKLNVSSPLSLETFKRRKQTAIVDKNIGN